MFGRSVTFFRPTQAKLADMLTAITSAQLIALRLGELKEAGEMRPPAAGARWAKRNNVRMALTVARTARGMLGANGISDEYPDDAAHVQPRVGRHLRRDVRDPHPRDGEGPDRHRRGVVRKRGSTPDV